MIEDTMFQKPDYRSYPDEDAVFIAFVENVRTAILSDMSKKEFLAELRQADMTYDRFPEAVETPSGTRITAIVRSISKPQVSIPVRKWYTDRIEELKDRNKSTN